MVQLADVVATLQRLDELSDTLEQGIQNYEHNIGVLRGQIQSLGARLKRCTGTEDVSVAVSGAGNAADELGFLNKLVSKVAGRLGKVMHWQSRPDTGLPSSLLGTPGATPTKASHGLGNRDRSRSSVGGAAADSSARGEERQGQDGPGVPAVPVPGADPNVISYEQRLAENERALQAKLLGLDPEDMWAEIAQMWAKITWARGLFEHLPSQEMLAVRRPMAAVAPILPCAVAAMGRARYLRRARCA